jgi:nitroreductase
MNMPGEETSDFMGLLRRRRSIRTFTPEKVDPDTIGLLTEALLRAPSSRGNQPWEFVVVDDGELLARLARSKEHGSEFLRNASLAVVVCADSTRSDVWVEDCAIAAIVVQLAAVSLGLGSCWAQIRSRRHDAGSSAEEYVRGLLGLPEHIRVAAIIGIGHPAETKSPVPAGELPYEKVKRNRYA